MRVKINAIYESISGEAGRFPQGSWCTFVRFQGCNLNKCSWCDTPQAQLSGGEEMTVDHIITQCHSRQVLITGGEPLLQEEALKALVKQLLWAGHKVQIETNGSFLPFPEWTLPPPISWVVDFKGPSSGMEKSMISPVTMAKQLANETNYIKFVISSIDDLTHALRTMNQIADIFRGWFIISPLDADKDKVGWIVDGIHAQAPFLLNRIIFSVQLHKILKMP